jgi:hypothetical protein
LRPFLFPGLVLGALKTKEKTRKVYWNRYTYIYIYINVRIYSRTRQAGASLIMAVPQFAGMSGKKLSWSISTIATLGFLLFGYDRKLSTLPTDM